MSKIIPLNPDHPALEAKERLNEMRLKVFFNNKGENAIDVLEMSSSEMLDMAIHSEGIMKTLPLHDYARQRFVHDFDAYLKLAEMQETRERYIHKLVA